MRNDLARAPSLHRTMDLHQESKVGMQAQINAEPKSSAGTTLRQRVELSKLKLSCQA